MTSERRRTALERMLEARSVAVVGASVREGSVGHQSVVELVEGGFEGGIYPVNPKYDEVLGHRAFASVAAIENPSVVTRPSETSSGISFSRMMSSLSGGPYR